MLVEGFVDKLPDRSSGNFAMMSKLIEVIMPILTRFSVNPPQIGEKIQKTRIGIMEIV